MGCSASSAAHWLDPGAAAMRRPIKDPALQAQSLALAGMTSKTVVAYAHAELASELYELGEDTCDAAVAHASAAAAFFMSCDLELLTAVGNLPAVTTVEKNEFSLDYLQMLNFKTIACRRAAHELGEEDVKGRARMERALTYGLHLLKASQALYGDDETTPYYNIAATLISIGEMYQFHRRFKDAEAYLTKAAAMYDALLSAEKAKNFNGEVQSRDDLKVSSTFAKEAVANCREGLIRNVEK